jgi:DNA-directed RNA polymerase subunit M/transcription elongation factor TFIIS
VQFCDKCDNVMLVKHNKNKIVLQCSSCGAEIPFKNEHKKLYTISAVLEHGAKDMTHVVQEPSIPIVTEEDREFIEDDEVQFSEE